MFEPLYWGAYPASKYSILLTVWGEVFLSSAVIPVCLAVGLAIVVKPCFAASMANTHKPVSAHARHSAQRDMPQKMQGAPCYQSQAGLIFLKASPGKGHLGHSNSFAPIGEAVFRSSANQHACIVEHGRRG